MSLTNRPYSSQLKLMHLIDSGGIYGAEVMLLNLIEEQLRNGLNPVLGSIARKGEEERPIETAVKSLGVKNVRFTASKGIDMLAGIKIISWAKKNKIKIIHTHGYKPNLLIAFFPRKWSKISIIRTLHGWTNTAKWSKSGIYQMLDVLSLRYTEALFAVSSAMLTKPPLLNSALHVQIIDNGIKKPKISNFSREEIKSDPIVRFCTNSHMLLSIGRLSKEKGFNNLIQGVALLIHDGVDVRLCIIGEGPQRECLEVQIKEHNLQDRVLLAGYRENATRFIPLFATYVLSSYTEGLPITILEAMHMGIPIVATKVGGVPETLDYGQTGSLLDSNDPTLIYTHIKMFIEEKQKRDAMIERAKIRAQTIYSATIMERKYYNAYLQLPLT